MHVENREFSTTFFQKARASVNFSLRILNIECATFMGGGSVESTEANLPISEYMLIAPVNLKTLAGDP
jgi:hypothetical protein